MKTNTIHRFIHALDKGELRYCRDAISKETGLQAETWKKLFEVLVQMKQYSNEEMKVTMEKEVTSAKLAVQKSRLFRFLVDQVKILRQNRSGENLWSLFEEGKLFMSMGLKEESYSVITTAIKSAVELEELLPEVALRELLGELLKNMGGNMEKEISDNEYLLQTASGKLNTLIKYTQINDRMFSLNRRYRFSKDSTFVNGVDELFRSEYLQNIHLADSLPSQLRFFRAKAGYYVGTNNVEKSLDNYIKCVELWESNRARIQLYPQRYLSSVSNVLGKLSLLGRLSESPKYLEKLTSLEVTTRRGEILKFTYTETQYYLYLMNSGRFSEAVDREKELESGLRKYGQQIPEDFRITLQYNIAVCALMVGDNGKALKWFNRIREMGVLQSRQDLQGIARLFRLLLIREDDSSGNFNHFMRNSKRFFNAKHPSYVIEEKVYSWLKKNKKIELGMEARQPFGALAESLEELSASKIVGAEELYLYALSRYKGTNLRKQWEAQLEKQEDK